MRLLRTRVNYVRASITYARQLRTRVNYVRASITYARQLRTRVNYVRASITYARQLRTRVNYVRLNYGRELISCNKVDRTNNGGGLILYIKVHTTSIAGP